jgi:hypothetical protein
VRRSVTYIDLTPRQQWFFQGQVESLAMFRRTAGAGSPYWIGVRDASNVGGFGVRQHARWKLVSKRSPSSVDGSSGFRRSRGRATSADCYL